MAAANWPALLSALPKWKEQVKALVYWGGPVNTKVRFRVKGLINQGFYLKFVKKINQREQCSHPFRTRFLSAYRNMCTPG